ncbi:hypothetical protein Tco_0884159, partial [Tanacetum coccineum]
FFDNETYVSEKTKSYESYDDLRERNSDSSNGEDSGNKSHSPNVNPRDRAAGAAHPTGIQKESVTLGEGSVIKEKDIPFTQQDGLVLGDSRTDQLGGISTSKDISDDIGTLSDDHENMSEDEDFGIFCGMFMLDESARFADTQSVINERIDQVDEPRRSRKYYLKLLAEFGMLAYKLCNTPIKSVNVSSKNKLRSVVEDKPLLVHCLSQMMHSPMQSRLKLALRVLSNVDSESMHRFKVQAVVHVEMSSDNSSTMKLAANPVLHERTKHFEIDLFFLKEKIAEGIIKTVKVKSEENVDDIFTKGSSIVDHKRLCHKLRLKDLFPS